MITSLKAIVLLPFFLFLLTSCEKGDENEEETGNSSLNKGPIRDKYDANSVAKAFSSFVDDVENKLSLGTHSSYKVTSSSGGTASVTGTYSKETISSYTTCYHSRLTITFSGYKYLNYIISGTITFKQDRYNSSKYHLIKEVNGSDVDIEISNPDDYTINDKVTVSFTDKNDNQYILTGNIIGSNGKSFTANP